MKFKKFFFQFSPMEQLLSFVLFIGLITINMLSFHSIRVLRGDARVINYAGIIRGASQKLVKQELHGDINDPLIERIDDIITELQTGHGANALTRLSNETYQQSLALLQGEWNELKAAVYAQRISGSSEHLYKLSEKFFKTADAFVFAAETVSELKIQRITAFRYVLSGVSLTLICIFVYQLIKLIRLQIQNKQLEEKAVTDQMTGLPNRWSCDIQLDRYRNMKTLPDVLCVSIDLNNLKEINDSYGHSVGDQLLVSFAKVLKIAAAPYGFVGRNGGDEFLAFFENFSHEKENEFLSQLHAIIEGRNVHEPIVKIDFAYGSALSSDFGCISVFELVKLADQRMYKNKNLVKRCTRT